MNISVVIPCYNEEKRIVTTIRRLEYFFRAQPDNLQHCSQVEILCIENGSTDKTSTVIMDLIKESPLHIKLMHTKKGKGNAVKEGVNRAQFEWVLIMDADNATDIGYLSKMIEVLRTHQEVDLVNSSRRIHGAQVIHKQGMLRQAFGNAFHILVHTIFALPVSDSQNGFKLCKTTVARRLYESLITSGWVSEVELFMLAKKRKCKIYEIPVIWHDVSGSTLGIKDVPNIVYDLGKIIIFHYFQKRHLHDRK